MKKPFRIPKPPQPPKYSPPKPVRFKEEKQEPAPHIMTFYEKSLIELLKPAIHSKNLIKFWYEDSENDMEDWRIVEPHLIGQNKYKAAHIWLSAWFLPTQQQIIQGYTPDWKTYMLDNIKQVEILDQTFRMTRINYNPHDKRMKTIFCATALRTL